MDAAFFVAGGTVPPGAASYVERAADRELLDALLAGEFCYVLNSRQMGKSSLAVRTIGRLNEAGVRTAFVDLTRLGATGADPERWYTGLMVEVGRALGLRAEAMAYLKANAALPAVARLFAFLRDEALRTPPSGEGQGWGPASIVLMVDEIDAVRSLPFPADDLFAGLRELWNARATDPALRRLTVCLLGAALPGDLIADPRRTPFNVGRRIELRDLTPEEAQPFASGLLPPGAGQGGGATVDQTLARVLNWTGGHPYLTQALCAELTQPPSPSEESAGDRARQFEIANPKSVDALVRSRYLDARARDADTNLSDVGRRLLGEGDPGVTDEDRAATLALYERLLRGRDVPDDEANPAAARVKMSGVARVEDGKLRVRNRIYAAAFDARWAREAMPGGELRRQKRAFWKGVLRTGAVAAAVLAVVGGLAWNNLRLARLAQTQRDAAHYDAYVASMMSLRSIALDGDLTKIEAVLAPFEDDPVRGWEWSYWKRLTEQAQLTIHVPDHGFGGLSVDKAGKSVAMVGTNGKILLARLDRSAPLRFLDSGTKDQPGALWIDEGRTLLVATDGKRVAAVDVATGRTRWTKNLAYTRLTTGAGKRLFGADEHGFFEMDLKTRKVERLPGLAPEPLLYLVASPDDRHLLLVGVDDVSESKEAVVYDRLTHRLRTQPGRPARWVRPVWSSDAKSVVMPVSKDGNLDDWALEQFDASSGKEAWSMPYPSTETLSFALSPDGRQLVVPGYHRQAALFEIGPQGPKRVGTLPETRFARFLPGGRLLTLYWDLRVYGHWPVARQAKVPHGFSPTIAPDGRVFGTNANGSGLAELLRDRLPERTWKNPPSSFRYADTNGAAFLQATADGKRMQVVDAKDGRIRLALDGALGDGPRLEARQPFDTLPARDLAAISFHDRVEVYDLGRGTRIARIAIEPHLVAFSPSGKYLICIDERGAMRLYTVADWRPVWGDAPIKPANGPWGLSFSPDERQIALATSYETVTLVDVRTGRPSGDPLVHSCGVLSVAWSPDGRRIASGDFNGLVHLWDVRSRREVSTIPVPGKEIYALRFLDGGRSIATVDQDGAARLLTTEGNPGPSPHAPVSPTPSRDADSAPAG